MDLRVLGPVTAVAASGPIDLGPRKRRLLLGLLALEVNRVLPVDRLVDLMWPQSPPRTAVHGVRVSASSLRSALRGVVAVDASGGGYVLRADPMMVDAHRFRHLVTRAGAETDDRVRLALLDEALALWHGPPLAGVVPREVRNQLCHGLEEARLAAVDDRFDALLGLGHDSVLLEELTAQVATHPLRERPTGQLMLALYRAGRVDDALRVYAMTRDRLAGQLGVDPGAELRELRQRILGRDPGLQVAADDRAGGAATRVPAQLPPAVPGFVGREAEVAQLDALLAAGAAVVAIGGAAGVGKTALAVHWAHRVAHRFPDGQLYANLRGFAAGGSPVAPAEVIRGFLEALGLSAQQLPEGAEAQAGLSRSLLTGQRVLLVLDNAADAEQVRPLLPGAPGCMVVVTSRSQLTSLVAVEGARPVPLGLLTGAEAQRLLAHRLGAARVTDEPEAVDELIRACASLPLALAIVAARAATNPQLSLASLARELRWQHSGLDVFDGGDAPADVRAVLSWSYEAVSEPAQRMFRLLGVHSGPSIGVAAAASAAAIAAGPARRLLRELAAAHLLTETSPDRFSGHDLLRAYAAELAGADPERDAVRERILDHYLHSAYSAACRMDALRDPVPVGEPASGVTPERAPDEASALQWFIDDYQVLMEAIVTGAKTGADSHTWRLACSMTEVFERLGNWEDWSVAHLAGLTAAQRLNDSAAEAHCLVGLGRAAMWLRGWDQAHARLGQALARFESLGDRDGQARAHHNIGYLYEHQGGGLAEALRHSEIALSLFRETGNPAGIAKALNAVGWYRSLAGEHEVAVAHCQEAIALLRELGDRRTEAFTWDSIGVAYQGLRDHSRAIECFRRSMDMLAALNDRYHEAEAAEHLGDSHLALGRRVAAAKAWQRALENLDSLGHPRAAGLRAKLAS